MNTFDGLLVDLHVEVVLLPSLQAVPGWRAV